MSMAAEKEGRHPVKTLHEFLFEISEAWDGFRTGSLISILTSIIFIVVLVPRLLTLHFRRGDFIESAIYLGLVAALAYDLWVSWKQHEFYKKWEKRIGLLMATEEELLGDEKK